MINGTTGSNVLGCNTNVTVYYNIMYLTQSLLTTLKASLIIDKVDLIKRNVQTVIPTEKKILKSSSNYFTRTYKCMFAPLGLKPLLPLKSSYNIHIIQMTYVAFGEIF